jgi:uncharacterized protein YaaW (UPF0174 family)
MSDWKYIETKTIYRKLIKKVKKNYYKMRRRHRLNKWLYQNIKRVGWEEMDVKTTKKIIPLLSDDDLRKELKKQVEEGYIKEDLTPLKCYKCKSTNLKNGKEYYGPGGIEEYERVCGDCGSITGIWSYGSWQL